MSGVSFVSQTNYEEHPTNTLIRLLEDDSIVIAVEGQRILSSRNGYGVKT